MERPPVQQVRQGIIIPFVFDLPFFNNFRRNIRGNAEDFLRVLHIFDAHPAVAASLFRDLINADSPIFGGTFQIFFNFPHIFFKLFGRLVLELCGLHAKQLVEPPGVKHFLRILNILERRDREICQLNDLRQLGCRIRHA